MVNLISSLLEELPLAVGSEEIARVPSTLRDQSDQVAAEESHQRHIKSLQVGRELFLNAVIAESRWVSRSQC